LDQHFLRDGRVADRLVELAEVSEKDTVLDIGAGHGIITVALAKAARKVYAIEKDPRLSSRLMQSLAHYPNVEVLEGNFIQMDLPHFTKVVSNPPFQIIEPLLNRVLLYNQAPMALILPYPLALRLSRSDATLLSLKVSLAYNIGLAGKLDPIVFEPPPGRSTCITIFKPRERTWVENVMIGMFRMGDKKVRNALRDALTPYMPKREATRMVELSPLPDKILEKRVGRISLREAIIIRETTAQHFYPRTSANGLWPR